MHECLDKEVCLNGHTGPVHRNAVGLERRDLFGLTRELLRPDPRSTNLLRGTQWFWTASSGRSLPLT